MQRATGKPNHGSQPVMPPPDEVELTIIIPTRNESENISPLLDRLGRALIGLSIEILFVDDSTDDTPTTIRRLATGSSFPVSVIARPEERRNGLSGAVVEGIEAARGRWFCVIDADLQHPPELIPRLLDQANRTGADIVVASRQADLFGPVGLSRARALTSQLLTILARMVFPRVLKDVSDPLTGFFLTRRAAIQTADLQPEGFKILLEILVRHPDLRVTELHFDFAQRHEGQSKADLNEGMRFFRHLTRLRLTVNQHLIRFLILIMLVVALNLTILVSLATLGWPVLRAAVVAGGITIAGVLVGETWVFNDRPPAPVRRRLVGVFTLGTLFLFFVYLPVIWILAVRIGAPVILAGLVAMIVAGFVYYLFSEQWIWTRGLMMRPRSNLYYDIHGVLAIASQIPLSDLDYFRVPLPPARIDLQLRVDRHGTPSRVPGAICYDEHLGRFGFGLTVIPGDFTEIVVSPLLETSPSFLYTNVVEPVLSWQLVTKGYSLARAGGAVQLAITPPAATGEPQPAYLITGRTDMSNGLSRLCRDENLGFLGDDRVIIGRNRRVLGFLKPVTATRNMLKFRSLTFRAALALQLQRLLYSRPIRQLGLFLSERQLPAATVNTYLQRIVPQPKFPLDRIATGITYGGEAIPSTLIWQEKSEGGLSLLSLETAIDRLLEPGEQTFGFRPYPLLINELTRWNDRDWEREERDILRAGLTGCRMLHCRYTGDRWWEQIAGIIQEQPIAKQAQRPSLAVKSA